MQLNLKLIYHPVLLLFFCLSANSSFSQRDTCHSTTRSIRYLPEGQDFVITNGKLRFNRALYGTNTGFRVEAGDLPEFALYMPKMGGNLKFGLIQAGHSKWLIDAKEITARYRPGMMIYSIKDEWLGDGQLEIQVLPMSDKEGIIVRITSSEIPKSIKLFCAFGGATGKRFHREGDIGADPESVFYLHADYCLDNIFNINNNHFSLHYGFGDELSKADKKSVLNNKRSKLSEEVIKEWKHLEGVFPKSATLKVGDATQQASPIQSYESSAANAPFLVSTIALENDQLLYYSIINAENSDHLSYNDLPNCFAKAEKKRQSLISRISLQVPDSFITPIGSALVMAADAIYEEPTYLHGAVAWRMRLNGWRGAYAANSLGWHNRAKSHFSAYALSQLTEPVDAPVVWDTLRNFARQKEVLGTALFSSGYICRNPNGDFRAHHYDMNQVFIDQLLRYFRWKNDVAFGNDIWSVIERHLEWQQRCFDVDKDGLYDAYCSIWASDALQYSGGGVTHSSAYNYFANKQAAALARYLGKDPSIFQVKAETILESINDNLWIPELGTYAEFRDLLGFQSLHCSAGLWTIYHAIDSEVADPFQAYQALRYVDTQIPHIPINLAENHEDLYLLSTTNWMPYTWSVNNVALAENLHTALAYWQSGRKEEAFKLWKSALFESMYVSSSPGSFQQLSFYDTFRGELYRDFADPIGIAARALVEGLFGIRPDVLNGVLNIKLGLPKSWNEATLHLPDIEFDFERSGSIDRYTIVSETYQELGLKLEIEAVTIDISSVKVNGQNADWLIVEDAVGYPKIYIESLPHKSYEVEIVWGAEQPEVIESMPIVVPNQSVEWSSNRAKIVDVFDPQNTIQVIKKSPHKIDVNIAKEQGHHTVFIKLREGEMVWWQPINFQIQPEICVIPNEYQPTDGLVIKLKNNTLKPLLINILDSRSQQLKEHIEIAINETTDDIKLTSNQFRLGTNTILLQDESGQIVEKTIINWNIINKKDTHYRTVEMTDVLTNNVTDIFKQRYASPRPNSPTVQIPLQGIGNWCYPFINANIDDSGFRKKIVMNEFKLPQGIPFSTPKTGENIGFTTLWDNYPDSMEIALSGHAAHAYFLLAGSTNHMQSQFDNGEITVYYTDGTSEKLVLRNPETWLPIEQDYYIDGYAFSVKQPLPIRLHLKTGLVTRDFDDYVSIKGYSDRVIDGGAATILDLPLNSQKTLSKLTLKILANEVVIGLMAVTFVE